MEVVFSSAALQEVREAAEYFEGEVEGVGKVSLGKLHDGISEIKDFPHASRVIRGDFRRHLLSRFPHGINHPVFLQPITHSQSHRPESHSSSYVAPKSPTG